MVLKGLRNKLIDIWNGEVRMGVIEEIRRGIDKIRWERWRAKQNKELEKNYCYAWGGDVPEEPTHQTVMCYK